MTTIADRARALRRCTTVSLRERARRLNLTGWAGKSRDGLAEMISRAEARTTKETTMNSDMHCENCGHPIAPEGVWLEPDEDFDVTGQGRPRCHETACIASDPRPALATPADVASIVALIPAPVKVDEKGERIADAFDWLYPRSEAYEAAVRPTLPEGWELYSVLASRPPTPDLAEAWARHAGKDFGATRDDGRAHVFGIRNVDGTPRHLRASVPSRAFGVDAKDKLFEPHELAAACRWCDEQLGAAR